MKGLKAHLSQFNQFYINQLSFQPKCWLSSQMQMQIWPSKKSTPQQKLFPLDFVTIKYCVTSQKCFNQKFFWTLKQNEPSKNGKLFPRRSCLQRPYKSFYHFTNYIHQPNNHKYEFHFHLAVSFLIAHKIPKRYGSWCMKINRNNSFLFPSQLQLITNDFSLESHEISIGSRAYDSRRSLFSASASCWCVRW